MPKEIWKTFSVHLICWRIWLPPTESILQSKWKFSLCMLLFQGPLKAESAMLSSIIRKEQAYLHLLLFGKYCHLLSCSISTAFHCKAGGMFWIVQIQVSMTSSSSLDSRSALPWLRFHSPRRCPKAKRKTISTPVTLQIYKEKRTIPVSVSVEGASVGSLCPELSCNHKVIFPPYFIELTLPENRSFFLWVKQRQPFMAQGCHKGHPLFFFSFCENKIKRQSMTADITSILLEDPLFSTSSSTHTLQLLQNDQVPSGWLLEGIILCQSLKGMWMLLYLMFFSFLFAMAVFLLFAGHFFLYNNVCIYTLLSSQSEIISCWNSWWELMELLQTDSAVVTKNIWVKTLSSVISISQSDLHGVFFFFCFTSLWDKILNWHK